MSSKPNVFYRVESILLRQREVFINLHPVRKLIEIIRIVIERLLLLHIGYTSGLVLHQRHQIDHGQTSMKVRL